MSHHEYSRMKYVLERIKAVRLERGLRQSDLAERLRVDQSHYSRLENGKMTMSLDDLHLIAKCLGVSLSFLTNDGNEYEYFVSYAQELELQNRQQIGELTKSVEWWKNHHNKLYEELMAQIEELKRSKHHLRVENQKLAFKEQSLMDDRRKSLNLVLRTIKDLNTLRSEHFTYQGFTKKYPNQGYVSIEQIAALNEFLSSYYDAIIETEKQLQNELRNIEQNSAKK